MPHLTPGQQRDVDAARAFMAAAAAPDRTALARHLGDPEDIDDDYLRAHALGLARVQIANLLDVIGALTGGQS